MVESIRDIQKTLSELLNSLKKIRSTQISHGKILSSVKKIVDAYFRESRNLLITLQINPSHISEIDFAMQALLEATHKKTTTSKYKNIVNKLIKIFQETEKLVLLSATESTSSFVYNQADNKIISTLKKLVPSAALSYEQALIDLQSDQRLSWRGPATDFRESLRECLDYLAPEKEVVNAPGFKFEKDLKNSTMRQKAIFILKNRDENSAATKTTKESIDLIDQTLSSFVRSVYSRASVSTHTPTVKGEVERIYNLVQLVLRELLKL